MNKRLIIFANKKLNTRADSLIQDNLKDFPVLNDSHLQN